MTRHPSVCCFGCLASRFLRAEQHYSIILVTNTSDANTLLAFQVVGHQSLKRPRRHASTTWMAGSCKDNCFHGFVVLQLSFIGMAVCTSSSGSQPGSQKHQQSFRLCTQKCFREAKFGQENGG